MEFGAGVEFSNRCSGRMRRKRAAFRMFSVEGYMLPA
jgi:hypothetical protein